MGSTLIQASLTGGELAPAEWARVDLARYQTSLKTCVNFEVQPYGGVRNRPGTQMIAETKTIGNKIRLIPFTFNSSQTYVLEFGDHYVRFFRNGAAIPALESVTACPFGTGAGLVKNFQLLDTLGAPVLMPKTVTVFIAGVEQSPSKGTNLLASPNAFDSSDWTKDIACAVSAGTWTPSGESSAVGDTLNWSA